MGDKGNELTKTPIENPKETGALNKKTTRRDFLKMAAVGSAGAVALKMVGGVANVEALTVPENVYVPNAKMMVLQDSVRCVGCKRCEAACSLAHFDKCSTALSGINISRNFAFGPAGPKIGFERGQGLYGDYRIIAETCLQCPHPVPCMTACPNGAIEVDEKTGARFVNREKCVGCGICQKACPYGMTTFDKDMKKAFKCDLCGGDPWCVKVCPAGAISYVPWRDRTKEVVARQATLVSLPKDVAESCNVCHKPSR